MPLDTSIYGNIRPIQLDNPLNNYAQITGIQNAQNQNRLADIQYRQAMKQEEDDTATREAISGSGGDYTKARNALMNRGLYKPAMAMDKTALENKKTQAEITAKDLEAASKRYDMWSAAMAPLTQKPNPTHEEVLAVGNELEKAGVIQPGWQQQVPMNALQLPDYVKSIAMRAENGRKAVEMLLPKVHMLDNGGAITPWNTNTMAGAVGPLAGAAAVTKVATPDAVMSDSRLREEGEKNRGVTMTVAKMNDARQRDQNANAKSGKVVEIEGKIRDDYTNASKQYVSVRDAHQRVLESAKDPSAAGDLALIFNYMKVLDPGSTVREGEFATAQNAGGVEDRVKSMYNRAINGERLAPAIRADFVGRSEKLYKAAEANQAEIENTYEGIAKRSGARPENVVIRNRVKGTAADVAPKPATDYSKMSDAELKKQLGIK